MDCSYVNGIIEKYDKNGQLTQNERTAYANLSQILNNWFNSNHYNQFAYYPRLDIQRSGSRAKGTAIKGKSDMDIFLSISDPYNTNTLKEYYDSAFEYLKKEGMTVRKQNVSIGVKYYNCDIDVVPAKKLILCRIKDIMTTIFGQTNIKTECLPIFKNILIWYKILAHGKK